MSDWNNLLRTWTAWRRYTLEQIVQRDTNQHQVYMQQLRLKETRAQKGHRSKLLHKTFVAWKKYVKMEQYNQEILKQQERTKAKMQALLDNVAAAAKEQEVVLTSLDGDEGLISEVSTSKVDHPVRMKTPSKGAQITKSRKPIHAWQVNRNHVKDLTVDEIRNIGDANHVKTKQPVTHNHRFKFQKKVIDEQSSLINKQKQLIEELTLQQREVNVALEQKVQERLTNVDRSNGSSTSSQLSQNRPRNLALLKRPKSVVAMEERA
uniref:Uncharacterized protein n=1 Tax=Ciona savignyi TaxID=51511 RepID=H2YNB7_CIOSA